MANNIVITGCSSGIGEHCALALKQKGWHVIATARTDEDISRLEGEGLDVVYLDYAEPSSIDAAAARIAELTGGKLYALFNNGAYGQAGAVEDLPVDALRAQFEANFFGWHDLTRRLMPLIRENGRGRIIQNSSILGFIALRGRGAYVASKYAVEGLTDTLRLELRGSGIEVISIQPGPITSMFREKSLPHFLKHIDRETSVHRDEYERILRRMGSKGKDRFELGPEAVFAKLEHALESSRPRTHYRVTTPTHIMSWARRILPQRAMSAFLARR